MTKGHIIDLVHINVSGGNITDESAIWRVDIEALLPAAVNMALEKQRNIQLQLEGDRSMPTAMFSYYQENVRLDDLSRAYVNVPVKFVKLPNDEGIRGIRNPYGISGRLMGENFARQYKYYGCFSGDMFWYKIEGDKIYLKNLDPAIESLELFGIVEASELSDSDELPIPAGREVDVMGYMEKWFLEQRKIPADRKNDNRDLN